MEVISNISRDIFCSPSVHGNMKTSRSPVIPRVKSQKQFRKERDSFVLFHFGFVLLNELQVMVL